MRQNSGIALWKKTLSKDGSMLLVLEYFSDDLLVASNGQDMLDTFKAAIAAHFGVEIKPRVDWYLQARIQQDPKSNILPYQQQYSKAIVRQYLPNLPDEATLVEKNKYRSPLPSTFKWTKADNS